MELKAVIFEDLTRTAAFVGLYILLLLLAKWMKDFCTPYKINDELTKEDNLAVAITMCGYYLGTTAIFVGALLGPSQGFTQDLLLVGGYSILGLIFLNVSRFINDKIILRKFCVTEQLIKEHNVAVGAVQFGTYLATGLIAAGAVSGTGGGVYTAIVFFLLGQISLLVFCLIYDWITPYSIHKELKKRNVAAGVALGGSLVALSIIVLNGVSGDFISWEENLINLAIVNIMAFVFLILVRFMMDKLVIPRDELSREIVEDKNLGAGFLEATVAISFSIVLKALL
ncbi:DUF350 domain-containing protein [Vibrio splendidus]|uniref:DUF350 domain-containing protein n=1 Tax=Vibrio splendidus TaxID=29497 RepID=UPI000C814E1E|nr:DUF350 domain-containing protein [Vibrio splendidus]PMM11204.1 hypothetical protein BCT62_01870 [Vibrio splendidus]PMN31030.1 hypothetical protein BCT36_06525 [Vibrio splendidus]